MRRIQLDNDKSIFSQDLCLCGESFLVLLWLRLNRARFFASLVVKIILPFFLCVLLRSLRETFPCVHSARYKTFVPFVLLCLSTSW
jgi:hypothetical protein